MEQHLKNIGQNMLRIKVVEDAYIEGGTIQITDRYTVKKKTGIKQHHRVMSLIK